MAMNGVETAQRILESLLVDLERHEQALKTLRAGIHEVLRHYPELRDIKSNGPSPIILCEECD